MRKISPLLIMFFVVLMSVCAQDDNSLVLYQAEKLELQGNIQFGSNVVAETNLFWNLADVPELDYDSDTEWLESYTKSGLGFTFFPRTANTSRIHGEFSFVWSSTLGIDAFDEGNTGRTTIEKAYIGYEFNIGNQSSFDLTLGAQELKIGTGMLIANGGVSGFERGALKFGPRKAWEMAIVGKLKKKNLTITGFYIDPNELPSNDTENEIIGMDFILSDSVNKYFGMSYLNVIKSNAPYPKAAPNGDGPPEITFGAREHLNAVNFYGKTFPLKRFFTTFDFAYQWNSNIDLNSWGGRAQIGYELKNAFWKPTLTFSYQVFSGDDPNTSKLERFDPLYFEGSPSAWSTGSKSSMVFINSNVKAFGISLKTEPSPKDVLTFRYSTISAQQLRSPIQFGQAARVEFSDGASTVISGVTESRLANDFFIEYNRVINRNVFLNAGFSLSVAGEGIETIVGNTALWTGGFLNIVFNY